MESTLPESRRIEVTRFGEKLRALRKKYDVTLLDLAEALGHADHTYLSRVENGKKTPSLDLILYVAQTFHVSTDQLLFDDLEVS